MVPRVTHRRCFGDVDVAEGAGDVAGGEDVWDVLGVVPGEVGEFGEGGVGSGRDAGTDEEDTGAGDGVAHFGTVVGGGLAREELNVSKRGTRSVIYVYYAEQQKSKTMIIDDVRVYIPDTRIGTTPLLVLPETDSAIMTLRTKVEAIKGRQKRGDAGTSSSRAKHS